MSDSNITILSVQQEFKKNVIEKMKLQNKRYLNSLKIIEKLLKENNKLKSQRKNNSSKKTKKKPRNNSSVKSLNNSDFTQSIELKSMIKRIDTALNSILSVVELIKRSKYLEKIKNFVEKTDETSQTLLMNSIQIINSYIDSNMNITQGILLDVNHKEIFNILNDILKQKKLEENLKILDDISNKITKIKRTKLNSFKIADIEKLENKLIQMRNTYNRNNLNIGDIRFTYKDSGRNIVINLNQIKEKVKDCLEFIKKKNKFEV